MATKLRIKMGHIEFEYEGDAPYNTDSVKDLFTHLETLMGATPPGAFVPQSPPAATSGETATSAGDELTTLGMNTVAARLGAKSGPEVAIAAAAHLQICSGKATFSRNELRTTMQAATAHYNEGMSSNLSAYLKGLIGQKRINSLANDQMSLSASEIATLKGRLAQS